MPNKAQNGTIFFARRLHGLQGSNGQSFLQTLRAKPCKQFSPFRGGVQNCKTVQMPSCDLMIDFNNSDMMSNVTVSPFSAIVRFALFQTPSFFAASRKS